MTRLFGLGPVCALGLAFLPGLAAAQGAGTMESTPCAIKLPYEGEIEGQTYDCGVVIVPENHADPASRTLELAWLRLKSPDPAPDPVVYLSGGPGSSAMHEISTLPVLFANMQAMRATRDMIFYDQRGTGRSQLLACGPFNAAIGVVAELFGTPEDVARLEAESQTDAGGVRVMSACALGYKGSGVDLSQYNSVSSAKDIAALTTALGYTGDYNLYGTSYGTRLALNAMRSTPERVRAVVVDGTISPGIPGNAQTTADIRFPYDTIFAECEKDAFCAATYPGARDRFIKVLGALEQTPLVFDPPLVPGDFLRQQFSGTLSQIDPHFFVELGALSNRASQGGLAAVVPMLTELIEKGDTEALRTILGRGTLPDVQPNPMPPSADEAITAEDVFFDGAITILTGTARAMKGAEGLSISDEWLRLAVTELAARLASDEKQAEVIKALVELAVVPLAGTDPAALTGYADGFLSPDTAAKADALVTAMTRQEVRETMWSIQGLAATLLGVPERDFISYGVLWSVNCAEDVSLTPVQVAADFIAASPYQGLQTQQLETYEQSVKICEAFPKPFQAAEMMAHVESDIPALIYAEGLDTQTPIPYGRTVAEHLSRSFLVEWPSEGHIIAGHAQDGCPGTIAAAFLADPETRPDTTCADAYRIPFQQYHQIMVDKLAAQ